MYIWSSYGIRTLGLCRNFKSSLRRYDGCIALTKGSKVYTVYKQQSERLGYLHPQYNYLNIISPSNSYPSQFQRTCRRRKLPIGSSFSLFTYTHQSTTMPAITLRQVQKDPNRKDIFGILNDYIQPGSTTTVSQAATSSTQSVKTPDEGFFWEFWDSIFDVAQQIPHSDPAQDKLALFVRELTLVPETGDQVWERRVWTDLPLLGPSAREHLEGITADAAGVSFHAFIARLLHAGVSPWSETNAIWMLRRALEEEKAESYRDSGEFDHDLATAAVYIEYAGATLVQKLALRPEPQLDEAERRSLRGGELWDKDASGLTADRWAFWGKRFRELGGDKARGAETKELALHAARLIEVWAQTRLSAGTS
ncbi:hypothetical protein F4678DRAFT_435371 [Xylaria arbuscula]|nr:hypothetical protein F4678DRAFT_435371 [Xylaria arbuscula]